MKRSGKNVSRQALGFIVTLALGSCSGESSDSNLLPNHDSAETQEAENGPVENQDAGSRQPPPAVVPIEQLTQIEGAGHQIEIEQNLETGLFKVQIFSGEGFTVKGNVDQVRCGDVQLTRLSSVGEVSSWGLNNDASLFDYDSSLSYSDCVAIPTDTAAKTLALSGTLSISYTPFQGEQPIITIAEIIGTDTLEDGTILDYGDISVAISATDEEAGNVSNSISAELIEVGNEDRIVPLVYNANTEQYVASARGLGGFLYQVRATADDGVNTGEALSTSFLIVAEPCGTLY